jgi:hypothetical protein
MSRRGVLLTPTIALIGVQVGHDLDHVRQSRLPEVPVLLLGGLAYLAAFVTLFLVLRRHRLASMVAVAVGFATALGFFAVHVLPDWGPLADGYPGTGADIFSWTVVLIDIGVALWLGLAGLRARRLHGRTSG